MEKILSIYEEIKELLQNVQNTNVKLSKRQLEAKVNKANEIKEKFSEQLKRVKFDTSIEKIALKFQELYNNLIDYLRSLEKKEEKFYDIGENNQIEVKENKDIVVEIRNKNIVKIPTYMELLKHVPEFDGNKEKLNNFIEIITCLSEELNENQNIEKLIEFAIKTKVTETARSKLSAVAFPNTLISFQNTFRQIFVTTRNALIIQKDIQKEYQGGRTVSEYSDKLQKLVVEINNVHIKEQGEAHKEVILKLNDQLALNSFKVGINEHLKPTVLASRPKTLEEAVNIALEVEKPRSVINKLTHNQNNNSFYRNDNRFFNNNNNFNKKNRYNTNYRPQNYRSFNNATNYNRNFDNHTNFNRNNFQNVNNQNPNRGYRSNQYNNNGRFGRRDSVSRSNQRINQVQENELVPEDNSGF